MYGHGSLTRRSTASWLVCTKSDWIKAWRLIFFDSKIFYSLAGKMKPDKRNANSYLKSRLRAISAEQKLKSKLIWANTKEANVPRLSDNSCMKSSGLARTRQIRRLSSEIVTESKSYCNLFLWPHLPSFSSYIPLLLISQPDIKSLLALQLFPLRLYFLWISEPLHSCFDSTPCFN